MIEKESLWSTELIINTLHHIDNKGISEWILNYKKSTKGRDISNRGGWQQEVDAREEILKPLNDAIHETLKSVRIKGPKEFTISMWINVNNKGDWNMYHDHLGVDLSGVYYVKVPKDSGDITFKDPRTGSESDHIVGLPTHMPLVPQEGVLLMFPAFLEHMVTPSKSDEERISIAYNVMMRDPINN